MRLGRKLACLIGFTPIVLLAAAGPAQQPPGDSGGLGQNAALRYWQAFAHLPKLNEGQQALLAEPPSATRPSAEAAKLAASGKDALLYLHRGAAIGPCDWGLHTEDGPYLLLPHLGKGRDLARLACLKARVDFADGHPGEAVDEAADTIVMGRHLSAGQTAIISYLVQLAVERTAI